MNTFALVTPQVNSGPLVQIGAGASDMQRINRPIEPQEEKTDMYPNDNDDDCQVIKSRLPYWIDDLDASSELVERERQSQEKKSLLLDKEEKNLESIYEKWGSKLSYENERQQRHLEGSKILKKVNQTLHEEELRAQERNKEGEMSDLRLNRSRKIRASQILQYKINNMTTLVKDAAHLTNRINDRFTPSSSLSATSSEEKSTTSDSLLGLGCDNHLELARIQREVLEGLNSIKLFPQEADDVSTSRHDGNAEDYRQYLKHQRELLKLKREAFLDLLESHRRKSAERHDLWREVHALRLENRQIRAQRVKATEVVLRSSDKFIPTMQFEIQKALQDIVRASSSTTSLSGSLSTIPSVSDDMARKVLEAAHYSLTAKMYAESELQHGDEEEITKRWEEAVSHMKREMMYLRRSLLHSSSGEIQFDHGVDPQEDADYQDNFEESKTSSAAPSSPRTTTTPSSSKVKFAAGTTPGSSITNSPVPRVYRPDPIATSRRRYERLNARRRESLGELLAAIPDVIVEDSDEDKTRSSGTSTRRSRLSGYSSGYSSGLSGLSSGYEDPQDAVLSSSSEYSSSLDGVPDFMDISPASVTQFLEASILLRKAKQQQLQQLQQRQMQQGQGEKDASK